MSEKIGNFSRNRRAAERNRYNRVSFFQLPRLRTDKTNKSSSISVILIQSCQTCSHFWSTGQEEHGGNQVGLSKLKNHLQRNHSDIEKKSTSGHQVHSTAEQVICTNFRATTLRVKSASIVSRHIGKTKELCSEISQTCALFYESSKASDSLRTKNWQAWR